MGGPPLNGTWTMSTFSALPIMVPKKCGSLPPSMKMGGRNLLATFILVADASIRNGPNTVSSASAMNTVAATFISV